MKIFIKIILVNFLVLSSNNFSQEDDFVDQLKSFFQQDLLKVNALVQTGLRYSLEDDNFQGGRTFEVANARLSLKGNLEKDFFYRMFFNFVNEPNILDAYIGYNYAKSLRITMGLMKPKQTLDFIPDPGSTDFIDRTKITGLLVQSREVGLSINGDVDKFKYWLGLFNGNKKLNNNNNQFYGIGRVQYSLLSKPVDTIIIGIHGSHGNSPNVKSGNNGPTLRGQRTIFGGDLRVEVKNFIFAAEYLAGNLETIDLTDMKEEIRGYYITSGYRIFRNTILLGRWQSWSYKEFDILNNQYTIGLTHDFTKITSFQINFDSYLPKYGENQFGISFLLQVKF